MGGLSWSLGGEREVDVLAHDPRAVGRWRWQNERALVKKKHCLKRLPPSISPAATLLHEIASSNYCRLRVSLLLKGGRVARPSSLSRPREYTS